MHVVVVVPSVSTPTDARSALLCRPFVAACVAQGTSNLSLYSILLVVPLLLDDRGWTSSGTGFVLVGLTAGMVVLNPLGGSVGDRRGRARPVVIGMFAVACGAALLTAVEGDSPILLVVAVVIVGLGIGFGSASLQTAALEAVPERVVASAAGMLSTSRYVGSIAGSVAISLLVGDGGDGARIVLAITTVAAVIAVASSTRIVGAPLSDAVAA